MEEKEIKLAKKILDKLSSTRQNAYSALDNSEKIENILLGTEHIREDSKLEETQGLLQRILDDVLFINNRIIDIKRTTQDVLNEIEIKK